MDALNGTVAIVIGGGSGLGAHILYNLVTGALGKILGTSLLGEVQSFVAALDTMFGALPEATMLPCESSAKAAIDAVELSVGMLSESVRPCVTPPVYPLDADRPHAVGMTARHPCVNGTQPAPARPARAEPTGGNGPG